jgi:serine/threonine protein kinase
VSPLALYLPYLLLDDQLEFLGGNVLDEKPFIVMPFLKNGNARDYIHNNPTCNRQKIVSIIVRIFRATETLHQFCSRSAI